MITKYKRASIVFVATVFTLLSLAGCSRASNTTAEPSKQTESTESKQSFDSDNSNSASTNVDNIAYVNGQYGFDITLPKSWKNYTIITSPWEGKTYADGSSEKVVESGVIISIRHPQWASENPRQDIPVMVFTVNQWNSLQQEKFVLGAAPMGPSELGRNNKYVFALPARYNYAFLEGYKEVETILEGNPLHTTQIS